MKKLVWLTGIAVLSATSAWAGERYELDVGVYLYSTYGEAMGPLGSAYNNTEPTQYIGCSVYAHSSGVPTLTCMALDRYGRSMTCTSTSESMLDVAQGFSSDSYIYLKWDTATAQCTYLYVDTNSNYTPKR